MSNFDDIRPYHDAEVRPTLDRLLQDPELVRAITALRFPRAASWCGWLLQPLVKRYLHRQMASVQDVTSFQQVVEGYMNQMIDSTMSGLSVSGLDKLNANQAYVFVSNHRDIAMDPAFVNMALYRSDFQTVRIAIGDNLLTKPFVSDLMRLNKSFIVNRSATAPREKLKAAKHLSAYIHHSVANDNANVWIAQREGRAKDGNDATNSAVVGMLGLNKVKTDNLGDYLQQLNIVPVSISYEWDACDRAKANELYQVQQQGSYEKAEHEDVQSIAAGITGEKGHVHVAFGEPLQQAFSNTDDVAAEIDRQVLVNYVLHPTNLMAYQQLHQGNLPAQVQALIDAVEATEWAAVQAQFHQRLQTIPAEQRDIWLGIYANPVVNKLAHLGE